MYTQDLGRYVKVFGESKVKITDSFIRIERNYVRFNRYLYEPSDYYTHKPEYGWRRTYGQKEVPHDRFKIFNDRSVNRQQRTGRGIVRRWGQEYKLATDCKLHSIRRVSFAGELSYRVIIYFDRPDVDNKYDVLAVFIMSKANAKRVMDWFEGHGQNGPPAPSELVQFKENENYVGWHLD